MRDSRLRATNAAAPAPNSNTIGGAGTGVPPLDVPPPLEPDEVDDEVELEVDDEVDDAPELVDEPPLEADELPSSVKFAVALLNRTLLPTDAKSTPRTVPTVPVVVLLPAIVTLLPVKVTLPIVEANKTPVPVLAVPYTEPASV